MVQSVHAIFRNGQLELTEQLRGLKPGRVTITVTDEMTVDSAERERLKAELYGEMDLVLRRQ